MKQIDYSSFKNIYKWNYIYELLYYVLRFCQNWIFYKRVYYKGLENIPEHDPVLFTPNHQNALMDALIVIGAKLRWQPVFIARGDIFHLKPILTKFLIFLKILPVYRIRDGKEALKNNDEIFNLAAEVIKNGKILAVYPEANHFGQRRLRSMSKGFAKIAFKAESDNDFNLNLKIVPVGINYKNYFAFRSTVQVNFGKPISLKDFFETYKENEAKGCVELKTRVETEIRPLMIDIANEKYYQTYESLLEIYNTAMLQNLDLKHNCMPNRFKASKEIIRIIDRQFTENQQKIDELQNNVTLYTEKLKSLQLRHHIIEKPMKWGNLLLQTLLLTITFPAFLFGFVNNILFFRMSTLLTKKIKDRNFHTSIQFVLGFFLSPIYYTLLFLIVWAFSGYGSFKWWYISLTPALGVFAFEYWIWSLKLSSHWYYRFKINSAEIHELTRLKDKITSEMNTIYSQFK